jgi:transposase InsO family protein
MSAQSKRSKWLQRSGDTDAIPLPDQNQGLEVKKLGLSLINGPQFIARDFNEFIRLSGMTHVRTWLFYRQTYGKIERWRQVLKSECIRPKTRRSCRPGKSGVALRFGGHRKGRGTPKGHWKS